MKKIFFSKIVHASLASNAQVGIGLSEKSIFISSLLKSNWQRNFILFFSLFCFGVAQAQVPNAPTNLVVTPINTGGVIEFAAPSNIGGSAISNYEYSTDGGTNWVTPSPAITTSPITISSGLTNCTSYSIKIRAVNASGSGSASASSSLTPTVSQALGIIWTSRNSASNNSWNLSELFL
jgi:hypothetical protein